MKTTTIKLTARSGQAIVELLVGLVALLALIGGLLQVASLSSAHTATMVEARRQAGEAAISDVEPQSTPDYIRDWQEGLDTKRYTRDDTFTPSDPGAFGTAIVNKSATDSAGWALIDSGREKRFSKLHNGDAPQFEFDFARGYDRKNVSLLPIVQSLLLRADSVEVESEAWITWTKGIY